MAAHQLMRKDGHIVAEGGCRIKRKAVVSAETRTRSLVTAAVEGGSNAIVAGTDSYRKGFRAVGLPKGALRIASR